MATTAFFDVFIVKTVGKGHGSTLRTLFSIGVWHIKRKRRAYWRQVYNFWGGSPWENNLWRSGCCIAVVLVGTVSRAQLWVIVKTLKNVIFKSFWPTHACTIPIANNYLVQTIIFSSFNDIDLLRSILANCCMGWCREKGTMAAVEQGRPPWLGYVFLPSFRLANCVSDVPNPKTTQKPTTVPPHISVNNGQMGTCQVPILCACTVGRHISHMNKRFVHLGCGGAWWSIGNNGRIVFLAIYYLFVN